MISNSWFLLKPHDFSNMLVTFSSFPSPSQPLHGIPKDDVPRGTLLMAATALVFQGPAALPKAPLEPTATRRLGLRGTPEQMVKVGMEGSMEVIMIQLYNNWLVVNGG